MKIHIMFIAFAFMSADIIAQENNASAELIQFDPLFWKDKLKLDAEQCQRIREINGEYYQNLFTAYQEVKNDHKALRSLADKSLVHRNQEIWDTFHPKQRKRWKRIAETTSPDHTNES